MGRAQALPTSRCVPALSGRSGCKDSQPRLTGDFPSHPSPIGVKEKVEKFADMSLTHLDEQPVVHSASCHRASVT